MHFTEANGYVSCGHSSQNLFLKQEKITINRFLTRSFNVGTAWLTG